MLELGHELAELAAYKAGDTWKEQAYAAFVEYASKGVPFTTEEVRWANPHISNPSELRAWGQVALRAQRNGVVKASALVRSVNPNVHGRHTTQWMML